MMAPRYISFLLALLSLLTTLSSAAAQSFQIAPTQIEIVVAPGFNHADQGVPITGTAGGFNFAALSVTSDAAWAVPSISAATGEVRLAFSTAGLTSSVNTATITVTGAGATDSFFVKASVAPLNIVKLEDDPIRSRTYGIQQSGQNRGCVVVIEPLSNTPVACVTVGKKPADLAVSRDGTELLAINCVDETVTVLDLATLRVKETIALPQYDNWGLDDTTADVAFGPGTTIYYTDGSWAPVLRVFDRTTRQVTQSVLDNGNGIGDFALSPDGQSLSAWVQYGWTAGWAGCYIVRFSVNAQGLLTFVERTGATYPTVLTRDPLDTPVLIDAGGERAYVKQLSVNLEAVTDTKRSFPKPVYSISLGGEIAATDTAVYQVSTGINLLTLPVVTPVQAVTNDYARLVYFNRTTRTLGTINLLQAIGPGVLHRNLSPADGSITLSPEELEWSPLPGVDRYRIYLGTSETVVENAGPTSATYLGEVTGASFTLAGPLTSSTKYFWRIDAVGAGGVVKGVVYEFTVSPVGTDLTAITTATVAGHAGHEVEVQLSGPAGLVWQATADQPWATFVSTSGTTPGKLTVILNAAQLATGVHTAQISVTAGGQAAFTMPVTLEVDPLALTVMESDRTSGMVYALSEDTSVAGASSRAYLLEIDSAAKAIKRVLRVGTSATDLAVHPAEGRIYVTNWATGSLLAIDGITFKQVQAYGFAPFGGIGYGQGDVYRVSAGTAGRLVVEEYDQWIDVSIFDTSAGMKLDDYSVREGGGDFAAGGRFYYHGENNSSGAELRKFDVVGDVFSEVAHARVSSANYYGSRTVVVAAGGERIFWNGAVFRSDLSVEWSLGQEIYATTPDGRFAFGQNAIYDIDAKQVVLAMPTSTRVSAYNSTTGRLVVQVGAQVEFYQIDSSAVLPAPVVAVETVGANSVKLTWSDESLETGFTLQMRIAGSTDWQDIAAGLGANTTSYTVQGLLAQTAYEFRIKADSAAYSSTWSGLAAVTTTAGPPPPPPPPVAATSKLIYMMSGQIRNWGEGRTTTRTITGYFIWSPTTNEAAQLIAVGTTRSGAYYINQGTFAPRTINVAGNRKIFAFAAAGLFGEDEAIAQLESTMLKGPASAVAIGDEVILAPRTLLGKNWALTPGSDGGDILVELSETYVLDIPGSARSNVANESINDVVRRLATKLEARGFQATSN